MFIKYGEEQHLADLMNKGEIYFNPCSYFRDLEKEQMQKGIGDGNDGGIQCVAERATLISKTGETLSATNEQVSLILERALKTPIFCMKKAEDEFLSAQYRKKLNQQFPTHTHALVIRDESSFLENIRYSFGSKAFAHIIFYQDCICTDFLGFLSSGQSDILFYPTKKKGSQYYANLYCVPIDQSSERMNFQIDDSNFYKTMFRKSLFFEDQQEYRIVLPHDRIEFGRLYKIKSFHAELYLLDDLVRGQ